MYSFSSGRRPVDLRNLGVRGGDAVLFSYGEIDVRRHIERISRERCCDYDSVIRPLVEQYVQKIVQNLSDYAESPLVAIVLAVPPPSDRKENPRVPYYGQLAERVKVTQRLNELLEAVCQAQRKPAVHYFHPFSGFANADGSLDHTFSDGHVHIRSECCGPIHQQLNALLVDVIQQR